MFAFVALIALGAPDGSRWKDSLATRDNPASSRAPFDLEGRYELVLTLANGRLQGSWTASRGMLFPGRPIESDGHNTLLQMAVLAEWLETPATDPPT